jgi:hypothetical protein
VVHSWKAPALKKLFNKCLEKASEMVCPEEDPRVLGNILRDPDHGEIYRKWLGNPKTYVESGQLALDAWRAALKSDLESSVGLQILNIPPNVVTKMKARIDQLSLEQLKSTPTRRVRRALTPKDEPSFFERLAAEVMKTPAPQPAETAESVIEVAQAQEARKKAAEEAFAQVIAAAQPILQDLTNHRAAKDAPVTVGAPRAIPINVDIFSAIPEANADIIDRFVEVLALKQLYLNKRSRGVEFEFVSLSKNDALLKAVEERYYKVDLVTRHNLKLHKDGLKPGFTITDYSDELMGRQERFLFLDKKIEANDADSGLYMWNGILDLAIALTILLDHSEESRQAYYQRIMELYNRLVAADSRVTEAGLFSDLLDDNIETSKSIARQLAIKPIEKYDIELLRALYIAMRELEAAA